MKNRMLEKMKRGEQTVGTFLSTGNAAFAECIGYAGLDYYVIDTEHGPMGVETAVELIKSAELHGTTSLVRARDSSRTSILKLLDIGAQGVVIPNIRSIQEVRDIVSYGKYYPVGRRGIATARACGYGYSESMSSLCDYLTEANESTMLLPQCETLECLERIEEITAIDGVDGIFVGPFDLSMAMGKLGQFDDPEFNASLSRILKACKDNGKYCFIFSTTKENTKKFFTQGFDSVTVSIDTNVFTDAYKRLMEESRPS